MYANAIRIGLLALGCAGSFWLGDRVASGRYEARIADVSEAIVESQNAAVERHNRELEVERKRADEFAAARSKQRQVAQGVTHDVARDADLSCEWRAAHRMRLESIYAAYGYAADGSSPGVPGALRQPTPSRFGSGGLGGGGGVLGSGLQSPAR